jgi:hypothetical protein
LVGFGHQVHTQAPRKPAGVPRQAIGVV